MGLVEGNKDQKFESLLVVFLQDKDTYLILENTSSQLKIIKSKVCNRVSDNLDVSKLNPFMRNLN